MPYDTDAGFRRWPVVNVAIIGITVALSALVLTSPDPSELAHRLNAENPKLMALLGNGFLHVGWLHLLGNMIFLGAFGNAVNARLGHLRYAALYVLALVIGGAFWSAVETRLAIGASGAVMGVLGAFLVLHPRNDVRIFYLVVLYPGTFAVSAFWVIAAYVGLDVLGLWLTTAARTAYLVHVVGAAVGFGIATLLVASGALEAERGEQNLFEWLSGKQLPGRPVGGWKRPPAWLKPGRGARAARRRVARGYAG